ncbi:auxin-responsive protein SAUR72-like [Gastrolobium bilobum]|uniref:auxin-responsive protein SAUR72-like n=1 Tax=Gastrolobium bilobum TaxID=150636 RepID=UPI002AAF445E|nr:auxin-responsive protein SAUR72-like [Gastrolobium bilobum]
MEGMISMKGKGKKKGLLSKTWERCKSVGRGRKGSSSSKAAIASLSLTTTTTRSKSWPSHDQEEEEKRGKKGRGRSVAPQGCFSVYVGPQMQRFVIKTEYANHPLFKMLLEEAESEYGYSSQGPLALPCNVDLFYKVLMEMDDEATATTTTQQTHRGCANFGKRSRSYHLLSPSRMLAINPF